MTTFLPLLKEIDLCRGDETLGCVFTPSWGFPIVFSFPKVLILKSLDKSWRSLYTKFIILNIKTLWPHFNGWDSTALKLQPLRGDSLLFTTKFPEIPATHFTDHERMKGWVNLWATNQTCTETHKIANLLWPEM